MLDYADFNEVYANKPQNVEKIPCEPPACFVGSYAPVAKAGAVSYTHLRAHETLR